MHEIQFMYVYGVKLLLLSLVFLQKIHTTSLNINIRDVQTKMFIMKYFVLSRYKKYLTTNRHFLKQGLNCMKSRRNYA